MLKKAIIICCLINTVRCLENSQWWPDEYTQHECRACKTVLIDREICPSADLYLCEEQQPLRLVNYSILTEESCHCQSIKCADKGWRLAVNGSIVDRIRCDRREWYTAYGETVPSAICIKAKPEQATTTSTPSVCPMGVFSTTSCGALLQPQRPGRTTLILSIDGRSYRNSASRGHCHM
ncbi:hypothetical protein PRIPAC_82894 [Pristionchus pacificus]|uniref:Uncharacterized protein n=1 Tax=Pristionchus pacificus TaxID=54126 RepID=A0A2A6CLC0_PRIPA|nr:hypothetical protein PRIPAC_82894 [Pristionchus pacificus]|eukprot:PDM78900.1 hypothetical protein PRIPAC_31479 [Pristionchus pacificus]